MRISATSRVNRLGSWTTKEVNKLEGSYAVYFCILLYVIHVFDFPIRIFAILVPKSISREGRADWQKLDFQLRKLVSS